MKFGHFPKEGGSWEGVVEGVELAEDVGFDSCWVNDHQVSESENYWPAPLTRLAGIGTATDGMELVTAALILPLYHALHVAQRGAMVDQMSGGRLTLGVALGYVPGEFDALDVPMEDRAGRLIEGLRFLDAFLSADGRFSFESPFWSVEDWRPLPAPVQDPRPPLWVAGWGDKAIERSVKFGDAWLPGFVADNDGVAERQEKQRAIVEERGGDWDAMAHPVMREAVIADTHEAAVERGERYLYRSYLEEYGTDDWSHPLVSREEFRDFERLAEDRFLVGTPAEVAADIDDLRDRLDVDHLSLRFHHSGMPDDLLYEQLELFGDEVVPEFA